MQGFFIASLLRMTGVRLLLMAVNYGDRLGCSAGVPTGDFSGAGDSAATENVVTVIGRSH